MSAAVIVDGVSEEKALVCANSATLHLPGHLHICPCRIWVRFVLRGDVGGDFYVETVLYLREVLVEVQFEARA